MSEPSATVPLAPVPLEEAWFVGIGDARNRRGNLRDMKEFTVFASVDALERLTEAAAKQLEARGNPLEGVKRPDKWAGANRVRRLRLDTPPADTPTGLRDRAVRSNPHRGTIV